MKHGLYKFTENYELSTVDMDWIFVQYKKENKDYF